MKPHNFNEKQFCEWDDYRAMFLMPIFASGMAKYAGIVAPPHKQAAEGMKAIITYWCDNDMPKCGEPDMVDAVAQIAIWMADQLFEDDTVKHAWSSIKSWTIKYCKSLPPKRVAKIAPKRVMKRRR